MKVKNRVKELIDHMKGDTMKSKCKIISEKTGISYRSIFAYYYGESCNMSTENAQLLADYFGVPVLADNKKTLLYLSIY